MKATAFDGIARDLGETNTRRGFFRFLGGAAVLGVGAVGLQDAADARRRGNGKKKPKPKKCRSWILSGGPSPTDKLSVDDDLQINLNGTSIFTDANKVANELPPVRFKADIGDFLEVAAIDENVACRSISPLWLHCATTGKKRQLSAGQNDGCAPGRTAGVFFGKVFTIKI
jgi:hypothetical protein